MKIVIHHDEHFVLNPNNHKQYIAYLHRLVRKKKVNQLIDLGDTLVFLWSKSNSDKEQKQLMVLLNHLINQLKPLLDFKVKIKEKKDSKIPILISYRNDQGKRMHGAFFDHYTIRHITQSPTKVLVQDHHDIVQFKEFIESTTFSLGIMAQLGQKLMPARTHSLEKGGLILIPGYSRELNDHKRFNFEKEVIKWALLKGQPLLAICAGSWTLWQSMGGLIKKVNDHCYSSMPYIVTDGSIGNNKPIHHLSLERHTLIHGAMSAKGNTSFMVNSVHWMAVDESTIPQQLMISGRSSNASKEPVYHRSGDAMHPEKGVVEAFENKFGAPLVGVQWHPEAYFKRHEQLPSNQCHLDFIQYMAKAGVAYQQKKQMLEELKKKHPLTRFSVFQTIAAMHELGTIEFQSPQK